MAYNLKVGLMATTTVVGSAVAFTKTQAGVEDMGGTSFKTQNCAEGRGGANNQIPGTKYDDTFHQMMIWKY